MANENSESVYQGISRNATCPCGSGKRFKQCHGSDSNKQESIQPKETFVTSNKIFNENELFCSVEGKYYSLGNNQQYLFVSNDSDVRIQLDMTSCHLLQEMSVFSTFKDHFENCSKKFSITEEQFNSHLNILDQQGVLTNAQSVIDSLQEPVTDTPLDDIAGICIRTCESPTFLKRILDSQIRRKDKFDANEKVFIFDDSKSESSIKANKEVVANATHEIEAFYLGLEWQEKFVNTLIAAFPDDIKSIQSILLPRENVLFSGGRIMNLALLFFAGKRYLNFDDDFILDDVRLHQNNADSTIQLGTRPDRIYDGYENKHHAIQAGTPLDIDPLFQHKNSLGLSVAEFNNNQGNYQLKPKSLSGLYYNDIKRFQLDSNIITSGNGWFGTSGKRDGRFLFRGGYKNILPPWKTAESFDRLLYGGYCWDSITQVEIIKHGVSTPAGINNTKLLAPTVSTCRGEDTLLCFMTSALYPKAVHLGFPWAIAHFRQEKDWEDDTFNKPQPLSLPHLIMNIISRLGISSSSSSLERLIFIKNSLLEFSQLSEKEFATKLQSFYLEKTSQLIQSLDNTVNKLTSDDGEYLTIIKRIMDNDLSHAQSDAFPEIEDATGSNTKDQFTWIKKELEDYANSLIIFSKLWQYCSENDFSHVIQDV